MFWMVTTVVLLLGYVTVWYRALKFAPVTIVASILVSATLITNILSAIFVTHVWNIQLGIQAFLTVLGITIICQTVAKIKPGPILISQQN
jgi:uncharacterized membrane protein